MSGKDGVQLIEHDFDLYSDESGHIIRLFTWTNKNDVSVQVINYGATIISIKLPDKKGEVDDVVSFFSNLKGYLSADNPYFGASIGRVANRIGGGKVNILGTIYNVTKNEGNNSLHGGLKGFDKVIWDHFVDGTKVILSYRSADLEEGYPGEVIVNAIFELTADNEFKIEMKATTTKPTVVNLTNHSYFNLGGHTSGSSSIYKHVVCINADRITEIDSESIPTGVVKNVAGTVFDLQVPKVLGDVIDKVPNQPGFDHNFCINKGSEQGSTFIARVHHPDSGRMLELYSNQPGVQFYTANFLPEKIVKGIDGAYMKHGAFCLETQNWPDAPNHDNFPNAILKPGETYVHNVTYKFSVKED